MATDFLAIMRENKKFKRLLSKLQHEKRLDLKLGKTQKSDDCSLACCFSIDRGKLDKQTMPSKRHFNASK